MSVYPVRGEGGLPSIQRQCRYCIHFLLQIDKLSKDSTDIVSSFATSIGEIKLCACTLYFITPRFIDLFAI